MDFPAILSFHGGKDENNVFNLISFFYYYYFYYYSLVFRKELKKGFDFATRKRYLVISYYGKCHCHFSKCLDEEKKIKVWAS